MGKSKESATKGKKKVEKKVLKKKAEEDDDKDLNSGGFDIEESKTASQLRYEENQRKLKAMKEGKIVKAQKEAPE